MLECVCCHSHITLDESKVYIDEETGTASPDIACPVCNENQGYTVLGKIEKYDVPEEKEEAKVLFPAEEEPEVEEEEEEEVVEESLHDRIRRKHLQESKVCPKCGKEPCECESLKEGEDCEDCDESCKEELKEGKACEDCDEPLEECGDQLKEALQGDAIYKTVSLGGMEGRDREVRYFSTEEAARENALNDTWNDNFTLYEISFKDNDKGVERRIGNIESGRGKSLADNESLKEDTDYKQLYGLSYDRTYEVAPQVFKKASELTRDEINELIRMKQRSKRPQAAKEIAELKALLDKPLKEDTDCEEPVEECGNNELTEAGNLHITDQKDMKRLGSKK